MPAILPPPRGGPKSASNINFPDVVLRRVDRLARARGQKRSPCVVDLVTWALDTIDETVDMRAPKAERRGTP